MDKALEVLHQLNSVMPLDDLIYHVRENECLGWDGPQVKAWGDACIRMKQLFAEPEQPEIDGEFESPEIVRVIGVNWEGIYSDGKLLIEGPRLNARNILTALGYKVKTLMANRTVFPQKLSELFDYDN
jgi:hypothetical protein